MSRSRYLIGGLIGAGAAFTIAWLPFILFPYGDQAAAHNFGLLLTAAGFWLGVFFAWITTDPVGRL